MKKAIVLAGFLFIGFSIFAKQLGIDNDEGWGTGRTLILVSGLGLVGAGLAAFRYPRHFARGLHFISQKKHLIAAGCLVAVVYAWVSQVNIKFLSSDYHYYGELARSFKNGQLHLADKPSDKLLALADPYDYDLRIESNVEDFPWDVSLYKDKFYLYYGPVPALLLSVLGDEQIARVADRHLVIAFAFGLFIYGVLIIEKFFARSFPNAPAWLAGLGALTFGLTAPSAIMIQESRLYQVAVFGAQFFFIGGCYWVYSALTETRVSVWKLGMAGVHWSLALGTRISIAPMILFAAATALIAVWILYRTPFRQILAPAFVIGIPLLVVMLGLAWYNWARFDSIFESGLIYTLTDINYPKANDIFASRHIGRNFYNYFVHPLRLSPHFPYLFRIEYLVSNERLGGFLYTAPYILFALLPVLSGVQTYRAQKKIALPSSISTSPESWLVVTCAGAAVIGILTILSFWTVQLRYTEDFMPSLLLFSTANVAMYYHALENEPGRRRLFSFLVMLFAGITIVASTLVALKTTSLGFWVDLADNILRVVNLK